MTSVEYTERLYLPWYHWILPLVGAGLLAAEIQMGYPGVRAWLSYGLTFLFAIVVLVKMSATKVSIHDGELWVADAHIPLTQLGEIEIVPPERRRKALGPELHPQAFVRQRGWIRSIARVEVADERDPTPYWVFSTRRPERIAELLRQRAAESS